MCVLRGCEKNRAGAVQLGDDSGVDSDFDVGQLIGVDNEELLHKKLIICSELLNWETLVNFYIRQNGKGETKLTLILLTWKIWRASNNANIWQMGNGI